MKLKFLKTLFGIAIVLLSACACAKIQTSKTTSAENTSDVKIFKTPDDITDGSLFDNYLKSSDYKQKLIKYAMLMDKKLHVESNDPYIIKPVITAMLVPVQFKLNNKHPSSGIWTTRFKVTRAGKTRLYNIGFGIDKKKSLKQFELLMGETVTSPQLAKDTYNALGMTIPLVKCTKGISEKDIDHVMVLDTKALFMIPQGWHERWFVAINDVKFSIPVKFISTSKGTSFTFEYGKAKCL